MSLKTNWTEANREKSAAARAARKDVEKFCADSGITHPQIISRCGQMPETLRANYVKAMRGDSPTAGIKAFCAECLGFVRSEVPACTALACPLYPYRPGAEEVDAPPVDAEEDAPPVA